MEVIKIMKRKCPVCKSEKNEFLSELSRNMSIMGDSFLNSTSSNVMCLDCGCVYVDIDAEQEAFDKYYNSEMSKGVDNFAMYGVEIAEAYYKHIYDSIKDYINFDSQIMDLGCGLGEFTKYLADLGYRNVIGVDPSKNNIEQAKEKGINCIQSDSFSTDPCFTGKFDMIIFIHVFEHILDMDIALENVKKMLKPEGVIYIEVPDAAKYCDIDFQPYYFFTYEHVTHYTLNTLLNIAQTFGLKLIKSDGYIKAESIYVVYGIYQNIAETGEKGCVNFYNDTKIAVLNYINYCKNKLGIFIRNLENSREELILWGIGASTAQVLSGSFDNCNVIELIDSNSSRHGLQFKIGEKVLRIKGPESILGKEATIVVLPISYKDSIIRQIISLGFKNKIITLGEHELVSD
jgi:2-polyprenyl-3-methyl-5-hydroxy-6-metoxy-1,4-benzoquinol methylase